MLKEIRVFAPASVSNIGCGFDIMGFALEEPGDEVVLRIVPGNRVSISKITGDDNKLPYDPILNTAGAPVIAMRNDFGINTGIDIEIHKKMPFGSGLGSSAASSVAATFAFNILMDLGLSKHELLKYALKGEMISSGTMHADNIAPALLGGFTLIRSYTPLDVIEIEYPGSLFCAVIHPHTEISTKMAREMLPLEIPLPTAIKQWGNCSGLIAGLLQNDFNLIGRSMEDFIAEPLRSSLIPNYKIMKDTALGNGAIGCSISGSGPSVFALTDGKAAAIEVADAIKYALKESEMEFDVYISPINKQGPRVIYKK